MGRRAETINLHLILSGSVFNNLVQCSCIMMPWHRAIDMPVRMLLKLPEGFVLVLMLTTDDLMSHFWRQVDILNLMAVRTAELLLLSKLWQDLSWYCICTTSWAMICVSCEGVKWWSCSMMKAPAPNCKCPAQDDMPT